ncbi:MAG TPA: DMT family transporter [Stellaceae bacterium]|nr:DMT family transporter [Stellaceae bacterium]
MTPEDAIPAALRQAGHPAQSGQHLRGALLVSAAALLWSTGGLIVRSLSLADAWTIVFWRGIAAGAFLLTFIVVRERRNVARAFLRIGWPGIVVALCYASGSISLVMAFRLTSVADTLVIMSSALLLAAVLGWAILRERVATASWLAMLACVAGIGFMVSDSYASGSILGDMIAGVIALAQAIAGVTLRRHRAVQMAPAMCAATLLTSLVAAPFATPVAVTAGDMTLLALFGAGQLGLGFALFSFGAPLIPVAEAALLSVLEPIFGPFWVWLVLGERPSRGAILGGLIVLAALAVHIRAAARRRS